MLVLILFGELLKTILSVKLHGGKVSVNGQETEGGMLRL